MSKIQTTDVFAKLSAAYESGNTIISAQGSSRSGKTYNIVLWIIKHLLDHSGTRCSIVRATLPALKGSVLMDVKDITERLGYVWEDNYHKADMTYELPNGSWIEFFSTDSEKKLRGRKRDVLFVNEANELSYIEWQQLQMRTTKLAILDYNPSFTDEHWITELNKDKRVYHFISTYKENPFLEQRIVEELESLKDKNKSLWTIYGLGLQSAIEGLIYTNWSIVGEIPREIKKRYIGVDFGFTNHQSAGVLVAIDQENKDLYLDELFYSRGMLTDDLISSLKPYDEQVISESADPRLVKEIKNAGISIRAVDKPSGSVLSGIIKIQTYNIKVTSRSTNIIKELKNYVWEQDRDEKFLNKPVKEFDHAMDAMRYVVYDQLGTRTHKPLSKEDLGL